jgi:uncharacterized protein YbaR (Trm112 family)
MNPADQHQGGAHVTLAKELLDLLACPQCKGPLVYDETAATLTCEDCRLRYRIEDDIPVLLIEEAEQI